MTSKNKITYMWRGSKGYLGDHSTAQAVGECLEEMERKYGRVDPKLIVKDAKPPNSPLHKYFEWDNTQAADRYRLSQARQLIASVHVQTLDSKTLATPVRAFVNIIPTENEDNRQYESITRVMATSDGRRKLLAKAKTELQDWQKRYAALEEFSAVFDAIAKITADPVA